MKILQVVLHGEVLEDKVELSCLQGVGIVEGIRPLYQLMVVGWPVCAASFQLIPGEDFVKPDCQYCVCRPIHVKSTDLIDGFYFRCKYEVE